MKFEIREISHCANTGFTDIKAVRSLGNTITMATGTGTRRVMIEDRLNFGGTSPENAIFELRRRKYWFWRDAVGRWIKGADAYLDQPGHYAYDQKAAALRDIRGYYMRCQEFNRNHWHFALQFVEHIGQHKALLPHHTNNALFSFLDSGFGGLLTLATFELAHSSGKWPELDQYHSKMPISLTGVMVNGAAPLKMAI